MTVEELKAEAKRQGYNLIKIKKQEKLLPCICGCNRRSHWSLGGSYHGERLKCVRCGIYADGHTMNEARENWNKMIRKADHDLKLVGEMFKKGETNERV